MDLGFLFCDQVGSTALLTQLGDAAAEEIRRDLFDALYRAVALSRGQVVKGSGDGLMVAFPSGARDALRCGELMIALVTRLARRELWADVQLRVGVSHGAAVFEGGDWYGAVVNLAARLCAAAPAGQLLAATSTVQAAEADPASWVELPRVQLKGFPQPVPVCAQIVDVSRVPAYPVPVPLDLHGSPALVEREAPLHALVSLWEAARAGGPGQHVVLAPPGGGVSRMLAEMAAAAGEPVVMHARRGAGEVIGQLLRSYAACAELAVLRKDAEPDAAALAAWCPLLGLRLGVAGQPDPHRTGSDLLRALVTRISSRRPVLVLLDGVALPDDAELGVPGSCTVIGRRDDGGRADDALRLDALSVAGVGSLLRSMAEDSAVGIHDVAEFSHAETGGIPRDVVAVADELLRLTAADAGSLPAVDAVRRAVPYLGLQTFGGGDSVRFHGRDRATSDVLTALRTTDAVVVVGSSGSGKSSVVRAGCLPRLRADGADVIVFSPGEQPLHALAAAWSAVRQDELDAPEQAAYLVIDQLEECFTLCRDDAERERFLDTITGLPSRLKMLATLRGDFYGRASEHAGLAELLRHGTVLMTPLTEDELRSVIERPAAEAHLALEPGLTDLIVADVTGRPGSLPLLSHALRETWRQRHGNTLTVADYQTVGRASGAIARTADSIYDRLSAAERDEARRIFLRLTASGEGVEDTRRRVPVDVLMATGETASVLSRLVAARLVTVDTDADGREVDELAHEALLREWPRLREWLEEDRDELRVLSHVEAAAREWDRAGRPETDLYAGRRLAAAEGVDAGKLNPVESDFLAASTAARDARRRARRRATRRLQVLVAALVVLLAGAIVATVLAVDQADKARLQARQALASRLATEAASVGEGQPDLAMLLAVQAYRENDQADSRSALLASLAHVGPLVAMHQEFGTDLYSAVVTPDGRTAAAIYPDGRFTFWDLATRKPSSVQPVPIHGTPTDVRLSPDGSLVAVGLVRDDRGYVEVRRMATGEAVGPPIPAFDAHPNGQITVVAISHDDRLVAADAFDHGSAGVWHIADGRPQVKPVHLTDHGVQELGFSSDDRTLLVGLNQEGALARIDTRTGRLRGPLRRVLPGEGVTLAISPVGHTVAFGDLSGNVVEVDDRTGATIAGPESLSDGPVAMTFSREGAELDLGSLSGSLLEVDPHTLKAHSAPFAGNTGPIFVVVAGGTHIYTIGEGQIGVWNTGDFALAHVLRTRQGETNGAATDAGHTTLVMAGASPTVQSYQLAADLTPAPAKALDEPAPADVAAVSPDGSEVAVAVRDPGSKQGTASSVEVHRISDGTILMHADLGPAVSVRGLAFSPDGSRVAAVTEKVAAAGIGILHVLSAADGRDLLRVAPAPADMVTWPTSGSIVSAQGTLIDVFDPATGEHRFPRTTSTIGVSSATTLGDGKTVAFGQLDGTFLLFDATTGQAGQVLKSDLHSTIAAVALSDDGSLAALGTADGELDIVDVTHRRAIGAPITTGDPSVRAVVLSADGRRAITVGSTGRLLVWDLEPTGWLAKACALAGRNLTRAEWSRYVGGTYQQTCPQWS